MTDPVEPARAESWGEYWQMLRAGLRTMIAQAPERFVAWVLSLRYRRGARLLILGLAATFVGGQIVPGGHNVELLSTVGWWLWILFALDATIGLLMAAWRKVRRR